MAPINAFEYSNLIPRPTGPFMALASRIVPGVGFVHRQVTPYADAWQRANRAALAVAGPRWIVLGDSMSQGIGASRFDAGWVNQVHDRLAADGLDYQIVNLSASGARTADVLDIQIPAWHALPPRPDAASGDLLADSPHPRPDLITLLIGSNDLLRKQYREGLPGRFAELLRQLPPGAVVSTLPNPRQAAAAVNELIAQAQLERGIVAADMRGRSMTSWRGKLAEDHFHPNELGYAGIAEVFYHAIREAVVSKAGA
jgi:lysophospholipase L1-like esterase